MAIKKSRRSFNAGPDAPAGAPYIESVAIGRLRPNPRNPRTHSKTQIGKIAASIAQFGFINPVVADDDDIVLAGHGRLQAARLAGLDYVTVVRFDHLTEAQKRAYLIADNRIAEQAGWDREMLAIELGELADLLPAEGLDVALTGFEMAEIDLLVADMAPSQPQPEDAHPDVPANPVTRRGDLWLLGKHRILCGDARNQDDFTRLMNGASAAAVFCDPPYNVAVRTIGGRGRIQHREFAFASGEMSKTQYREFLALTLANGVRVSTPGAIHFVCIDWRHVDDVIGAGRAVYESMLNLVVWNKSNAGQGSFYRSQHELIGVFRVGDQAHRNNVQLGRYGRNRSNVWNYPGVNTFGSGRMEALAAHPTVKPVALVADAIMDCTARGDIVLDQFVGSGTTVLAADKVGRQGFALEYEPAYVDVAIERWQKLTRRDAVLSDDGRTFAEIRRARLSEQPAQQPEESKRPGGKLRPVRAPASATGATPNRMLKRGRAVRKGRGPHHG